MHSLSDALESIISKHSVAHTNKHTCGTIALWSSQRSQPSIVCIIIFILFAYHTS